MPFTCWMKNRWALSQEPWMLVGNKDLPRSVSPAAVSRKRKLCQCRKLPQKTHCPFQDSPQIPVTCNNPKNGSKKHRQKQATLAAVLVLVTVFSSKKNCTQFSIQRWGSGKGKESTVTTHIRIDYLHALTTGRWPLVSHCFQQRSPSMNLKK